MFKNYPDVVSPDDIQTMLQVGRNTVYGLLHNNEIKSIRIGKAYKIPKKYVIDFILDKKMKNNS